MYRACTRDVRLGLVFGMMLTAAAAQAQSGWVLVAASGPSARWQHAMAYDSQRGRTVLFGGDSGGIRGDTWEWDGNLWTQVATTAPSARGGHAMAYDSQRGRVVLFGGYGASGRLGDTWEWDGNAWTQVAITGPPARGDFAMAYDSQRGHTVLFGGWDGTNARGDTWTWDGTTWQPQLFASGPSARADHAMAYDSQRRRVVLFAGSSNSGVLRDTWEWNGSTWFAIASTGPIARFQHKMAFDQRGRTVLFGGREGNGTNLGDTWDWDGNSWTQLASTGPPIRAWHAMAYDSQRARIVLFGGGVGGILGDTWEWSGLSSSASTFGTGCGSPALDLSPVASAPPKINSTAQVSLTNLPSSLAFVTLGWSRTASGPFMLPLPLAGFGMPGCDLLQSADSGLLPATFTGTGTATFNQPMPNSSILIGLQVYLQGLASAPGVNPASAIVSNGVEWVIGNS